jgi:hypothetical protein
VHYTELPYINPHDWSCLTGYFSEDTGEYCGMSDI